MDSITNEHSSISKVLHDFGEEVLQGFQDNLSKKKGIASGELFQSMKFTSKILGNQFVFQLDMGVDYWKAVDEGRIPSKGGGNGDLFKNILKWVNVKATFGGFSKVKNLSDRKVQRGLAYVITRKIHKEGTKGNNFYSKVITKDRLKQLQRDLSKAGAKDLQTIIQQTVKGLKNI